MVTPDAAPDDEAMTHDSTTPGWPAAGLPSPKSDDTGPSLTTWLLGGAAVVVGALLLFGVVVPAAFSLLWLAVPVLLVVLGVKAVSKGSASTPVARIAGWASAIIGGLWLWNAIDAINLGRLLLAGLLVGGGVYVWRRLTAKS
jgi:hypothetical protein